MSTILWVNIFHDGPSSGLALYKGEEVWFARIGLPSLVSSVQEVECPEVKDKNAERKYGLYRISSELAKEITEEHRLNSEKTGMPFMHGDPMKMNKTGFFIKYNKDSLKSMSGESVEHKHTSMGSSYIIEHKNRLGSLMAELITVLDESDFSNYHVECKIDTRRWSCLYRV